MTPCTYWPQTGRTDSRHIPPIDQYKNWHHHVPAFIGSAFFAGDSAVILRASGHVDALETELRPVRNWVTDQHCS